VDPKRLTNRDTTQIRERVYEIVSRSNVLTKPQLSPVVNKFSNREQQGKLFKPFFQSQLNLFTQAIETVAAASLKGRCTNGHLLRGCGTYRAQGA